MTYVRNMPPLRWSIRRKLLAGLGVVALMLAVLVYSGLRASYPYRQMVKATAEEIEEMQLLAPLEKLLYELAVPIGIQRRPPDLAAGSLAERLRRAVELTRPFMDFQSHEPSYMMAPGHAKVESDCITGVARELAGLAEQLEALPNDAPVPVSVYRRLPELAARLQDLQHAERRDVHKMLQAARADYRGALATLYITSLTVLGLLIVLGLAYYRWVSRPVSELQAGVASLRDGQFNREIHVDSGDEMQDLAEQFNLMTRRLQEVYASLEQQVAEKSRRLALSERLASVGFLGAGVAHEINNPLSSIAGCAEALERRLHNSATATNGRFTEVAARHLKTIREEAFRCKQITRRLLDLSRPDDRGRQRLDLAELTGDIVAMVRHIGKYRHKSIDLRADGPVFVKANPLELKQVVLNLAANGLESIDEQGSLLIRTSKRDGQAVLEFRDDGCGMDAQTVDRVFEPFFSLKATGRGIGLGLSITHSIVRNHGGDIRAASDGPGRGSSFIVTLPLAAGRRQEV